MIAIQNEQLTIGYEAGLIETTLSNGWTIKQCFQWYVDYDGVQVEYDPDAMEVIGAEDIEEYSAEQRAVLAECEWDITDLKQKSTAVHIIVKQNKNLKQVSIHTPITV